MNEIELIRRFRAQASQPDPDEAQKARDALMEAIDLERLGADPARRGRLSTVPRRTLAVALAIAVLPAGYAIAEGVGGSSDDVVGGSALSAGDCPEIAAIFERADLPMPNIAASDCPSREEIKELLPTFRRDVERVRQVVPGWPDRPAARPLTGRERGDAVRSGTDG